MKTRFGRMLIAAGLLILLGGCGGTPISQKAPPWELENPLVPLPDSPLGIESRLAGLKDPPTPERVRLGRWFFYDKRLSADATISCATCHQPQHAFSELRPVSTGIKGLQGSRKAPSLVNLAWVFSPHFFWDGRANSLEAQALVPIANPVEMGNTHEALVQTLERVPGYRKYFKAAFGTDEITKERIAKAIADFERTRMSGDSPWDRWKNGESGAVSEEAKRGTELFFGKAECNQCHLGQSFTDSKFHNLGIGWNPGKSSFSDQGRYLVTGNQADLGAFKTPTLRDVRTHPPYMHDGSLATLREVVMHYNQGGIVNPTLSPKISPLGLTESEVIALVRFMEALSGQGPPEKEPKAFPQ